MIFFYSGHNHTGWTHNLFTILQRNTNHFKVSMIFIREKIHPQVVLKLTEKEAHLIG